MGSSNISAKSAGQEEFEFLQGLWGSGGAGGGTATTSGYTANAKGSTAGAGASIGGAIATLIGSIVSDSGSNFRTKAGTATGTQEAVKQQTISQGIQQLGQLTAIEEWAQSQVSAQQWDKKVVRNASPKPNSAVQGIKPIEQTGLKSQYGYRPIDMYKEEAWAKQGGLTKDYPKDMPYDVVGGLDIPTAGQNYYNGKIDDKYLWKDYTGTVDQIREQIAGSLTGELTGTIGAEAGAQAGAGDVAGEKVGDVAGEKVGDIAGEKTIAKDIAIEKEKEIKPVEQQEKDSNFKPPYIPYIPNITEGSNMEENVQNINYNNLEDVLKYLEEAQAKQWAREDAIRLETQQREDSAYQRAVADMRKSGVNPNLVGVNPAESGGGITNATGMDFSMFNNMYTAETNKYIKELELALEIAFKEDNNEKNRITDLITGLISSFGSMISAGILAMK